MELKELSDRIIELFYAVELNDFLDYNILWKIPNDDDLNDAIAQIKGRRK